jgi:hypothetical protein
MGFSPAIRVAAQPCRTGRFPPLLSGLHTGLVAAGAPIFSPHGFPIWEFRLHRAQAAKATCLRAWRGCLDSERAAEGLLGARE